MKKQGATLLLLTNLAFAAVFATGCQEDGTGFVAEPSPTDPATEQVPSPPPGTWVARSAEVNGLPVSLKVIVDKWFSRENPTGFSMHKVTFKQDGEFLWVLFDDLGDELWESKGLATFHDGIMRWRSAKHPTVLEFMYSVEESDGQRLTIWRTEEAYMDFSITYVKE